MRFRNMKEKYIVALKSSGEIPQIFEEKRFEAPENQAKTRFVWQIYRNLQI